MPCERENQEKKSDEGMSVHGSLSVPIHSSVANKTEMAA